MNFRKLSPHESEELKARKKFMGDHIEDLSMRITMGEFENMTGKQAAALLISKYKKHEKYLNEKLKKNGH